MTILLAAVLLGSPASAGQPLPPSVHASTAGVSSTLAAAALGASTFTVSTLYTGDRYRDPFIPPSAGGSSAHSRDRNTTYGVDIHGMELHGIMKDETSDFAIFSSDDHKTYILRGGVLYDDHRKRVPGITGRIKIKQKRVELITADKDVQVFKLGQSGDDDGAGEAK